MPKPHHIQLVKSAFREKVAWTAEELAGRMECHERTVRRCMDHLRDHEKWPIDSGKFGYVLRESSLAESRVTAPKEIAALAMVYEALRLLGGSKLVLEIRSELVEVKSWVLGFGGAATVIAPDELRELVREEVEQMQVNCEAS